MDDWSVWGRFQTHPSGAADGPVAIPLRHAPAGSRSEDQDLQTMACRYLARGATSGEATLFSASVGVDLKTDGDQTNTRSGPLFHEILLATRSYSCRASTSIVNDDRF